MKSLLIFIFILQVTLGLSQKTDTKTQGVIISTKDLNVTRFIQRYTTERVQFVSSIKKLKTEDELTLIESDNDMEFYNWCIKQPEVLSTTLNYILDKRLKPNDARINELYHHGVIKSYDAWDITTGGKDFDGKDIVIGIVDDGYQMDHEDLIPNLYSNPDEIAGDGKDNDGNGYVDDFNGWNQRTSNGVHDVKSHGTNILGVLGAKGNNGKGIVGMNWDAKLLPVTANNRVSDIIECYNYFLTEKRLYNTTQGAKGSNILVVSYSGGLQNAFAKDFAIWCNLYDKLGQEGILSVASTTNEAVDVELVGDMPSTCTSPYLLIVNSTDKSDQMDRVTGYGAVSVDLAAPGESILSTDLKSKNLYKIESGTSLSTPMVAGAAALVYSLKCKDFHSLVTKNRTEAVLAVKQSILEGVEIKSSLQDKTTTGGRLNVFNAMNIILEKYCGGAVAPKGDLQITQVRVFGNQVNINYVTPDNKTYTLKLYDSNGREIYTEDFVPPVVGEKILRFTTLLQLEVPYIASIISGKSVASKTFYIVRD